MTKKFKVVRLIDFLTFGIPALTAIGLMVGALLTPGNAPVGKIILAMTVLGFLFIYSVILVRRFCFSRDIAYITSHGIIVMASEFTPGKGLVEKEIERVVRLWEYVAIRELVDKRFVREAVNGVVLRWAKAPFTMLISPKFRWMGMTSGSGETMVVGFVEPLERSALGHELGHVILMHWKCDSSEEGLKAFHDKYGTPY